MMSEHCEPTSVHWIARAGEKRKARANSTLQKGSGRPIEPVGAQAREIIAPKFEPLGGAKIGSRSGEQDGNNPDDEGVEGTAMAGYAITCQAMIDRMAGARIAVIMLDGMQVVVDGVISRAVAGRRGSGGHARLCVSIVKRHNTGELSDHEKADQKWNDSPKASKPLHR